MTIKGKFIGINQRVPFDVINTSIDQFLTDGVLNRELVLKKMLEYTSGLNRAGKAAAYVNRIVSHRIKILEQYKAKSSGISFMSLKVDDRKAFCLCLICLTFPITYDLLVALAQGLKVQTQVNKKFISEKVMSIYGSNRTVDIAIDALLPMVIEFNTIMRDKVSIYSLGPKLVVTNKFVWELVIYTDIVLSGTKSILVEDLAHKPWYSYFNPSDTFRESYGMLVSKKDSAVGKGYLTAMAL